MSILRVFAVLLPLAVTITVSAAVPAPVAQPRLAIAPRQGGWDLSMSVPREVPVTEYNVEVGYRDPKDGSWKYPGLLTNSLRGGNEAKFTITPEMLGQFSTTATRWRVRARHAQPPGSWGEWMEFDASGTAVSRAATGGVSLDVWQWDATTQDGRWAGQANLQQAASSTIKLRWKPPTPEGEAAHWEFRAGPAKGTFETAGKIDEGMLTMPKPAGEWGNFTIDLGNYKLKGPPERYYVVVRHMQQQSRVVTISRESEARETAQSLKGTLDIVGVSPELTTAINGPDAKAPDFNKTARQQNHIDVRFRYAFDVAPGGNLYPALLDASGKITGRNFWEWAPLKGSKGEVEARMTLTCPVTNAPVMYVSKVHVTITDAAGTKVMKQILSLPRTYAFICVYSPEEGNRYDMRFVSVPDPVSGTITLKWGSDPKDSYVRQYVKYTFWGDILKGNEVYHRQQVIGEGGVVLREDGQWFKGTKPNNFAPVSVEGGYEGSVAILCRRPGSPGYVAKFRVTAIRVLWRQGSQTTGQIMASASYPMNLQVICQ